MVIELKKRMNRMEIDWFCVDFLYIEFLDLWVFVISWNFFFVRSMIFSLVSNSMAWIKNKPKNCFIENEPIKYFIIKLNQTDSSNHNLIILFLSFIILFSFMFLYILFIPVKSFLTVCFQRACKITFVSKCKIER